MYNVNLAYPKENDKKSLFSFLQKNPEVLEEYYRSQESRKILNQKPPQMNRPTIRNQFKDNNNSILILDSINGNNTLKYNIVFQTCAGTKHKIIAPINLRMIDLFKYYVRKIGLSEYVLGKDLFFISNANKIDVKETRTIKEMGITDNQLILVIDAKNLVGA
jgi:hypothetical protein